MVELDIVAAIQTDCRRAPWILGSRRACSLDSRRVPESPPIAACRSRREEVSIHDVTIRGSLREPLEQGEDLGGLAALTGAGPLS